MTKFQFENSPLTRIAKVRECWLLTSETEGHQTGEVLHVSPRLNTKLREAKSQGGDAIAEVLKAVTISCWPAMPHRSKLATHGLQPA